jgi:hypothetical protein
MKLLAVLSWFDEPLPLLASCLEGMARGGVDHLVAVDGAYRLFPGGEARSHIDQHAVLTAGTKQYGIGLTLVVPSVVWAGNEVEKREYAFRQALAASAPGDWFWSLDADEIITAVPDDLKDRLRDAEEDAALIGVHDTVAARARQPDTWPADFQTRRLFRAQQIIVDGSHYRWRAADGRLLWGAGHEDEVPCLDLSDDVRIEHRPHQRDAERLTSKQVYYTERDDSAVERGTCARCDVRARVRMPVGWRFPPGGGPSVARVDELCERHAAEQERVNRRTLRQRGIDPDRFRWNERYRPLKQPAGA